jgi:hypothetical protein
VGGDRQWLFSVGGTPQGDPDRRGSGLKTAFVCQR